MKLAKALKTKNRIAGEIAQIQKLIIASNVTESDNKPDHDVTALMNQLTLKMDELATIKSKIAAANVPIAILIARLAESKSHAAFLRTIPTKHGSFLTEGRYGTAQTVRDYTASLKGSDVETLIAAINTNIEKLQDAVDEFNATTEI